MTRGGDATFGKPDLSGFPIFLFVKGSAGWWRLRQIMREPWAHRMRRMVRPTRGCLAFPFGAPNDGRPVPAARPRDGSRSRMVLFKAAGFLCRMGKVHHAAPIGLMFCRMDACLTVTEGSHRNLLSLWLTDKTVFLPARPPQSPWNLDKREPMRHST